MALNDYETSEERGQPVQLFLFRFGPGVDDYYAYTDGETEVVYDSVTYEPLAIDTISDRESRQDQDTNEMRFQLPLASPVVELFRIYPPTQIVGLTVREGHIPNADDPGGWAAGDNFPVSWMGRVLDVTRNDNGAELLCEAGTAAMERPGLRKHFQYQCPYTVYRGRCGANKASKEKAVTVTTVGADRVTMPGGWPLSGATAADYSKGTLEWETAVGRQVRTILRVDTGNVIVLAGPTTGLVDGGTAYVYPGCTKLMDYCRTFHNAIVSFGGFPGIPPVNPVGKNTHT